jgi:hypothetical protein
MSGRNQPIRQTQPSPDGAPKDSRLRKKHESLAEETNRAIDEAQKEIARSVRDQLCKQG